MGGLNRDTIQPDPAGIERMLAAIRSEARFAGDYTRHTHIAASVLEAMARVPRHAFVPDDLRQDAYADRPLPIGHGQTISQPYIVALMTHLLGLGTDARVLEIGTGCGYQTAILAELASQVYSVEVVDALSREATARLHGLGYRNIETRVSDGYDGWPEQAPFDGIIVTAAATDVPAPLVEQLKPEARLVIPVGERGYQTLEVVTRSEQGEPQVEPIIPVAFVPLVHHHLSH